MIEGYLSTFLKNFLVISLPCLVSGYYSLYLIIWEVFLPSPVSERVSVRLALLIFQI